MSFIGGIATFAGLWFLIALILGIISPKSFANKQTGEIPKRAQLLVKNGIKAFVAFLIAGALHQPPEDSTKEKAVKEPSATQATTQEKMAERPKEKSIGIKLEAWKYEFNKIAGQINAGYEIEKLDTKSSEKADTFQTMLNDNIGITGSFNKDNGEINDILIIVGGSNPKDPLRPIITIMTATQAANPNVPKEKNSKIVLDMVATAMKKIEKGEIVVRTVGNLRYTASASKITGLMFSISHQK